MREETQESSVIIGGIGPRGILFHTAYVAQTLSKLWRGIKVNQNPRSHAFYDCQYEEEGPGNAFQSSCDGSLNTGLPGAIPLEKDGLSPHQCLILDRLTDVASRYKGIMSKSEAMAPTMLQHVNISTALLVCHASRAGDLDTSIACGPRNVVGLALKSMCNEASDLANKYIPWLKISFNFGMEVIRVDVAVPSRPLVTIRNKSLGLDTVLPACDLFIKATGTTWTIPKLGRARDHAYAGIPQHHALRQHFHNVAKLDEKGFINPGTRVLVGGAGLSALDHIGIILSMTRIVSLDQNARHGYKIDQHEAKKYPELITLFSPSQDGFPPPRLNEGIEETDTTLDDLVTPEMLFSIRLQRDIDSFATYLRVAQILTALACKVHPKDIGDGRTADEKFDTMMAETKIHAEGTNQSTTTEVFQWYLNNLFFPRPMEDPVGDAKTARLFRQEPWEAFRSMSYNATHNFEQDSMLGAEYIHAHKAVMRHVASMPFILHLLLSDLYDSGVVNWQEGEYQEVQYVGQNQFELKSAKYEVLIVNRVLTSEADVVWKHLNDALGYQDRQTLTFSKGRFLKSRQASLIHVIELGLPGHGDVIDGHCHQARWNDTNSFQGAHDLMPKIVQFTEFFERVVSTIDVQTSPLQWIMQEFEKCIPTDDEFNKAVIDGYYAPFIRLMQFLLIAEISEDLSENGHHFADRVHEAMQVGYDEFSKTSLNEIGHRLTWRMGWLYTNTRAMAFHPLSLKEFLDTSPDFTPQQIQFISDQLPHV